MKWHRTARRILFLKVFFHKLTCLDVLPKTPNIVCQMTLKCLTKKNHIKSCKHEIADTSLQLPSSLDVMINTWAAKYNGNCIFHNLMRKEKCSQCVIISMCGMCEIKKYAKIWTKQRREKLREKKEMSWGQQKHCTRECTRSESFVGARSSISWCLMRDLLIILSAEGDPRFASFIFFLFVHICRHVDIEMAAKYYFFVCAAVLTINCKHFITLHTVRSIAKIQSILSSLSVVV